MEDSSTVIALLTVLVVLLSILTIVFLGVIVVLLYRFNKIVKHVESVSKSVAEATSWIAPSKLISSLVDLFRK